MKGLFIALMEKSFEKYLWIRDAIKDNVEKLIMKIKEGTHTEVKSA
jgi:hypothetical protein